MKKKINILGRDVDIEKIENPKLKALVVSLSKFNSHGIGEIRILEKDLGYADDDDYDCYRDGGY